MTRLWVFTVLLLTSLAASGDGPGQSSDNVESTIQFLLNHVADSGLIFIRNSKRHDAADAAGHMSGKYEYFRDKIKTPEDFIQRCASKSLLSGRPYLVVLENGEETRTDDWLLHALAIYRHGVAPNSFGPGAQKEGDLQ
ncbi:MAG: DUF5329 family protein [Xanthomonadales bacterium]|nr:DUF5329 family protein [Xanthomonadales bacterium]